MLNSKESSLKLLATDDAASIARQITQDHEAFKDGSRPSPLVWHLPSSGALTDRIIKELYPENRL